MHGTLVCHKYKVLIYMRLGKCMGTLVVMRSYLYEVWEVYVDLVILSLASLALKNTLKFGLHFSKPIEVWAPLLGIMRVTKNPLLESPTKGEGSKNLYRYFRDPTLIEYVIMSSPLHLRELQIRNKTLVLRLFQENVTLIYILV